MHEQIEVAEHRFRQARRDLQRDLESLFGLVIQPMSGKKVFVSVVSSVCAVRSVSADPE